MPKTKDVSDSESETSQSEEEPTPKPAKEGSKKASKKHKKAKSESVDKKKKKHKHAITKGRTSKIIKNSVKSVFPASKQFKVGESASMFVMDRVRDLLKYVSKRSEAHARSMVSGKKEIKTIKPESIAYVTGDMATKIKLSAFNGQGKGLTYPVTSVAKFFKTNTKMRISKSAKVDVNNVLSKFAQMLGVHGARIASASGRTTIKDRDVEAAWANLDLDFSVYSTQS